VCVLVILASGLGMVAWVVGGTHKTGAGFAMPLEWLVMTVLGVLMMLIFGHLRFALLKRLQRAVAAQDWPAGGTAMTAIRAAVSVNLVLGGLIVVVTLVGALS
jgi:uncharacterized membrane protein